MIRLLLAATALAIPGVAAAQHQSALPGALAGRSPVAMHRPAAAPAAYADAGCTPVVSAGNPAAGRLVTRHVAARPDPSCSAVRMATTEEPRTTGRD